MASTVAPSCKRALDLEDPLRRRRAERRAARLERLVLQPVVAGGRRRSTQPGRPVSSPRRPFWNASLKVRPIAIASPTDFICVVSVGIGRRELLEGEARDLHHDVVEHRLERRRRRLRDVVRDLVETVADGDLRPDARDRKPRRLRRERRRARHARIHLDDEHLAVARVHGELDVAAAGVDADLADDRDRRVAHHLILAVGERHRRRDGDRVAGVDAHRIEVLDRADDDDVVVAVAHHLELELLPADDAALDEHLSRRRQLEPAADDRPRTPRGCTRCRRRCRRG